MSPDSLERIISNSGNLFGVACSTTNLVAKACKMHNTGPTASLALGRALTGSLLLAALLKGKQSVQLKFEGNGPLGKIITEAGCEGWARGYISFPQADLPLKNGIIDVAGGLGRAGFLTVTKNIGFEKKYSGTVQLLTSEIGEDIAYYLSESEQVPSAVSVGVHFKKDGRITSAGGFIIQSLPPADDTLISILEEQIIKIGPITSLLRKGQSPGEILATLFDNIPHKKTSEKNLYYKCSCNREKMQKALHSLGMEDIEYLLEQQEETFVQCEFCRVKYVFDRTFLQQAKELL